MRTSETIAAIAAALSKAQGAIKPAQKDAENPAFRSKYADLASVWEACREHLAASGLAVIQEAVTIDGATGVITRIVHTSGEWIEHGPLVIPAGKDTAHGVGSAISYGKRYALSAALGIVAEEDDDGNAAVKSKEAERERNDKQDKKAADDRLTRARQSFGAAVKEAAALSIAKVPTTPEETRTLIGELIGVQYDAGTDVAFDEFRAAETELRERIRITKAEREAK